MSAPAQKPRPAPVVTIAPTAGSSLARLDGVDLLLGHRRRPRVEPLRPVQRDDGDVAADLVGDLRVSSHPAIVAVNSYDISTAAGVAEN